MVPCDQYMGFEAFGVDDSRWISARDFGTSRCSTRRLRHHIPFTDVHNIVRATDSFFRRVRIVYFDFIFSETSNNPGGGKQRLSPRSSSAMPRQRPPDHPHPEHMPLLHGHGHLLPRPQRRPTPLAPVLRGPRPSQRRLPDPRGPISISTTRSQPFLHPRLRI